MRRMIWKWVVDADAWVVEATVDAMLAALLALVVAEGLRFLVESM